MKTMLFSGDLAFYRSRGALLDRLITWRTTPGDFVHCGVILADGSMIDATGAGVTRHKLIAPDALFDLSTLASLDAINSGLSWLQAQVGDGYGYADVLDDVLPGWWPVIVKGRRAFDCSHLAAQFLIECGLARLLGAQAAYPERITPNDLARVCGLL